MKGKKLNTINQVFLQQQRQSALGRLIPRASDLMITNSQTQSPQKSPQMKQQTVQTLKVDQINKASVVSLVTETDMASQSNKFQNHLDSINDQCAQLPSNLKYSQDLQDVVGSVDLPEEITKTIARISSELKYPVQALKQQQYNPFIESSPKQQSSGSIAAQQFSLKRQSVKEIIKDQSISSLSNTLNNFDPDQLMPPYFGDDIGSKLSQTSDFKLKSAVKQIQKKILFDSSRIDRDTRKIVTECPLLINQANINQKPALKDKLNKNLLKPSVVNLWPNFVTSPSEEVIQQNPNSKQSTRAKLPSRQFQKPQRLQMNEIFSTIGKQVQFNDQVCTANVTTVQGSRQNIEETPSLSDFEQIQQMDSTYQFSKNLKKFQTTSPRLNKYLTMEQPIIKIVKMSAPKPAKISKVTLKQAKKSDQRVTTESAAVGMTENEVLFKILKTMVSSHSLASTLSTRELEYIKYQSQLYETSLGNQPNHNLQSQRDSQIYLEYLRQKLENAGRKLPKQTQHRLDMLSPLSQFSQRLHMKAARSSQVEQTTLAVQPLLNTESAAFHFDTNPELLQSFDNQVAQICLPRVAPCREAPLQENSRYSSHMTQKQLQYCQSKTPRLLRIQEILRSPDHSKESQLLKLSLGRKNPNQLQKQCHDLKNRTLMYESRCKQYWQRNTRREWMPKQVMLPINKQSVQFDARNLLSISIDEQLNHKVAVSCDIGKHISDSIRRPTKPQAMRRHKPKAESVNFKTETEVDQEKMAMELMLEEVSSRL